MKPVPGSRSPQRQRVFIFGYYGWQNTGDDAMLYVLLQELPGVFPEAEFVVLSRIPAVIPTSAKDRVRFVKPAAIPALGELLRSQVFVIGGGTHIHDYGQGIQIAKILLRLLIIVTLAKLSGNRVYLISNGVGPISTIWGRMLTKAIFHRVDSITVRDSTSYQTLKRLGIVKADKVSLSFDLSARLTPLPDNNIKESADKKILGVCVTPVFKLYYDDREKDLLIISEIARGLNQWLIAMPRLYVYLFVFKDGPRDSDVQITELLEKQLKPAARVRLIPYNPNPRQTLAQVARCSAFVGTKYHSCLFAYLSRVPLLIIDYHPKCRALADEIGSPKPAIVSLNEILKGQLGKRLQNLLEHPEDFLATLPTNLARERAKAVVKETEIP